MRAKDKRPPYTSKFKLSMINYANEYGNRITEKIFWSLTNRKKKQMICYWHDQKEVKTIKIDEHKFQG